MTVTDQLKIIDYKINANQAQYDLGRLAGKISANSSGEIWTFDWWRLRIQTECIRIKKKWLPSLSKVFTKGLNKDYQKEGSFKRLENIEGKNEQQLKAIKNQRKK